jgi:glycosyltransferase involved in cell wall biosynthesis
MAAPEKDDSWIDPSKRAGSILDYFIEDTSDESRERKRVASTVEAELQKAPLIAVNSSRLKSRVLFITKDQSVFEDASLERLRYLNLADTFDEIHILVLCGVREVRREPIRLAPNIWAYTLGARFWWQYPFAADSFARLQLSFGKSFRPDIIVALDPFESGLTGIRLASRFDRAFQVHILENYFTEEYRQKSKENRRHLRLAAHVLRRAQSVRVATDDIASAIRARFKHVDDIQLLPRHYNIRGIIEAVEGGDLPDAFPQFSFVILYVGTLDHESRLFRAIDASRGPLKATSIGLVVLGDGPNKKEFQQRAQILGIAEQVFFEKDESKLVPFLKSANILICPDIGEESDETIIKAAAAGLPILMARTELRADLFTDGESAFLCDPEDTEEFAKKLSLFLNTNSLRTQFALNAQEIVKTRLHEDPASYKQAYRDSIELAFLPEEEPEAPAENVPEAVPQMPQNREEIPATTSA